MHEIMNNLLLHDGDVLVLVGVHDDVERVNRILRGRLSAESNTRGKIHATSDWVHLRQGAVHYQFHCLEWTTRRLDGCRFDSIVVLGTKTPTLEYKRYLR